MKENTENVALKSKTLFYKHLHITNFILQRYLYIGLKHYKTYVTSTYRKRS